MKLTRQKYEMMLAIRGIDEGFLSDILEHMRKCQAPVPKTRGWAYSLLNNLRNHKLVTTKVKKGSPKNMRSVRLTPKGERTLDKWLNTIELLAGY